MTLKRFCKRLHCVRNVLEVKVIRGKGGCILTVAPLLLYSRFMKSLPHVFNLSSADLAVLNVALVVDARWNPCPGPLLGAKEGIAQVNPGEVLEIRADDPEACRDIAAWAGKAGHEFLGFAESEGYARIFVTKTAH